jgi:hypothetical protein
VWPSERPRAVAREAAHHLALNLVVQKAAVSGKVARYLALGTALLRLAYALVYAAPERPARRNCRCIG